jgi:hypothetical protein
MAIVGQTDGKSWRVIGYSIPATSPGQHAMADKCRELEEDLRTVVDVAQRNLPNPHPTIERIAGKYQVNSELSQQDCE